MANAFHSENPDRNYFAKGQKGISPKVLFPKKAAANVNVKYPAIAKQKGMRFIKGGK